MSIRRLSWPEIRAVYSTYLVSDFPKDEVKPLFTIESALRKGGYVCYADFSPGAAESPDIRREDSDPDIAGIDSYAFFIVAGKNYLLDYFAVIKDVRGRGIGSRFLKALLEDLSKSAECILLEIENPAYAPDPETKALRESRRHFYYMNGLEDTKVEGIVFGVEYRILEYAVQKLHTRDQIKDIYKKLYLSTMNEYFHSRNIKLRD